MFVIGLQSRAARYRTCLQRFDDIGLRPKFFEGVDGSKPIQLQPGEKWAFMPRGTAGCALAHYRLWKHALNKGYDRIAVFEDDVNVLHPDLKAFLAEAATFDDRVELINLMSPLNGDKNVLFSTPLKSSAGVSIFLTPHLMIGAQGYIINRIGLNKLVSHALPIVLPSDAYMGSYEKHGLRIYISNQIWVRSDSALFGSVRSKFDDAAPHRPPDKPIQRAMYIASWIKYVVHKKGIVWRRRLYALRHAREFFVPNAFPSRLALARHVIKSVRVVW